MARYGGRRQSTSRLARLAVNPDPNASDPLLHELNEPPSHNFGTLSLTGLYVNGRGCFPPPVSIRAPRLRGRRSGKVVALREIRRKDTNPGVIESAFGLLDILRAHGRARLTDLTAESGLPRTTVYRLLGQLANVGAVERVGSHYRLGPSLLTLGHHVTPTERLRALAQRPLIELASTVPAHVGLITNSTSSAMYLEVLIGRDRLPFRREPGEPTPSKSAGAQVLRSGRDFVIDDGRSIDGVSCAARAIPLPGADNACIGIVVPHSQLPRTMLAPLRTTARRISTLVTLHLTSPTPGAECRPPT